MELYILEIIVFIILAIIVTIVLKAKKIKKIGVILGILLPVWLIALVITFLFERPMVNLEEKQLNLEVKQFASISAPKTTYHFKYIKREKCESNIFYIKL